MEFEDSSFAALLGTSNLNVKTEKSGLEEWFDRVYELPFSLVSVEDLARSSRQKLFPEQIVPRVLRMLREQPIAGEMYEGELIDSLSFLPMDFWKHNVQCRKDLIEIFEQWADLFHDSLDHLDFDRLWHFVFTVKNAGE